MRDIRRTPSVIHPRGECWDREERRERRNLRERIREITDLQNRDVLEIGCGDGRITKRLAGVPKRLVAIDFDRRQIATARGLNSAAGFHCGSGEELAFRNDSFDVVLFTFSLHHQNSAAALQEAYRVLRPGGVAVILEPTPESEFERLCSLVRDETPALEKAQEAIAGCGLDLECADTFDAKWVFDDQEELHSFVTRDCGRDVDAEIATQIAVFLQERVSSGPLSILDGTLIQLLRKPAFETE